MILQFQRAQFLVTVEEIEVGRAFDVAVGRYDWFLRTYMTHPSFAELVILDLVF
jgi:hypothetical protein